MGLPTAADLLSESQTLSRNMPDDLNRVASAMVKDWFDKVPPGDPASSTDWRYAAKRLWTEVVVLALARDSQDKLLYPSVNAAVKRLAGLLWQVVQGKVPIAEVERLLSQLVAMDKLLR